METKIFAIAILMVFVLSGVSADAIMPGYKVIGVTNVIENIEDYPEYIFILGTSLERMGPGIVDMQYVAEDGTIPGKYYKLASPSVFAINKDKWNESKISKFMTQDNMFGVSEELYEEYVEIMHSLGATEVIKSLNNQNQIPESSTVESETKTFSIDLEKVKEEPNNIAKERENWKYLIYFGVPILAMTLIIYFVNKRK